VLRAALLQIFGEDRQLILNDKLLVFSSILLVKHPTPNKVWSEGVERKDS
jgi:hypothetical protein